MYSYGFPFPCHHTATPTIKPSPSVDKMFPFDCFSEYQSAYKLPEPTSTATQRKLFKYMEIEIRWMSQQYISFRIFLGIHYWQINIDVSVKKLQKLHCKCNGVIEVLHQDIDMYNTFHRIWRRFCCTLFMWLYHQLAWWRHQMESFSALLAICEGIPRTKDSDAELSYFLWSTLE